MLNRPHPSSNRSGWLFIAAEKGDGAVVRRLCPICVGEIDQLDNSGFTALHVAIRMGKQDVASYLISSGYANLEKVSKGGSAAIHFAAELGHSSLVELLLEREAEAFAKNKNGWDPLCLAASGGHDAVIKALLRRFSNSQSNHPNSRDWVELEYLLQAPRHFPVNLSPSNSIWTPLCLACNNGHVAVVKVLLEEGFNVNSTSFGWTPLDLAAQGGHEPVVELLLNCGATIDPPASGLTDRPLHWAARHGSAKMTSLLIAKGAGIDELDIYGCTALEIAVSRGHLPAARILASASTPTNLLWETNSHYAPVPHPSNSPACGPDVLDRLDSGNLAGWKRLKPVLSELSSDSMVFPRNGANSR